ncbi:uncharacterized protein TM35_000641070 [Trypanosoma theileri]|uniref:Titin n=1 Tax=Trypanosoma theileri TaxID=67003 RepID=A0A1X0NFU3_9TRYP|nr:uncharacterized protein TM35_000641070 [Trypanosoma theileri]ORC83575.1 hypothetical protein TM35_000641070 [Trypanosoma theileri]
MMMRSIVCLLVFLLSVASVCVKANEEPGPEPAPSDCTTGPCPKIEATKPVPPPPVLPLEAVAGAKGDTCPGDGTSDTCGEGAAEDPRGDGGDTDKDVSKAKNTGPTVQLPEAPPRESPVVSDSTSTKRPDGAHPAGAQAEEENQKPQGGETPNGNASQAAEESGVPAGDPQPQQSGNSTTEGNATNQGGEAAQTSPSTNTSATGNDAANDGNDNTTTGSESTNNNEGDADNTETTTTTTTTLPPELTNNKKGDADSSSSISSSVWVRVPLLIVVTLACILVC